MRPLFWRAGTAAILGATLSLAMPAGNAAASERKKVCVKYETRRGWSEGYEVQATILSGSELNQATRSLRFNSYSKYVVVFWDKNEASILELSYSFLTYVEQDATDQYDRRWQVSAGGLCL